MIIAIDGESGTGKSTVARLISEILGWVCVKTGEIYRQVAYIASNQGIDCTKEEDIFQLLEYSVRDNCLQLSNYNGEDAINSEKCACAAAMMAASTGIKNAINNSIQLYIKDKNAVIEGRSVTTNMFPKAVVRVLLFADVETRTIRRAKQLENDSDLESVRKSLEYRDQIIPSGNGYYDLLIDTSNYDVEDTVATILRAYYKQTHTRSLLELKHFLYSSYHMINSY